MRRYVTIPTCFNWSLRISIYIIQCIWIASNTGSMLYISHCCVCIYHIFTCIITCACFSDGIWSALHQGHAGIQRCVWIVCIVCIVCILILSSIDWVVMQDKKIVLYVLCVLFVLYVCIVCMYCMYCMYCIFMHYSYFI